MTPADRGTRRMQHGLFREVRLAVLRQRREVVENPEPATHRREHEVTAMHLDVGDRRDRQVALHLHPRCAIVVADVQPELGAEVEQALTVGILSHDACRRIIGHTVGAGGQQRPGAAVISGAIGVRLEIAEQVAVDGDVRRALAMARHIDVLHPTTGRHRWWRDLGPGETVVARDMHRPVVRARPDHARLDRRFLDRVQRGVVLLAGHVARDRAAADALCLRIVRCQVGRHALPRDAFVARAMQELRAEVHGTAHVRRCEHRGHALEPVLQVLVVVAVQRLHADPRILFLARTHVQARELALARAVHDIAIPRAGQYGASLASRTGHPVLRRLVGAVAQPRQRRNDQRAALVLLRAIELVRIVVVHEDLVDLRCALVVLRAPAGAAIDGDVRAAVVGLHHEVRIGGVDPDVVVVAVRCLGGGKGTAGIGALPHRLVLHVYHVGVHGIGVDVGVVERPQEQRVHA